MSYRGVAMSLQLRAEPLTQQTQQAQLAQATRETQRLNKSYELNRLYNPTNPLLFRGDGL